MKLIPFSSSQLELSIEASLEAQSSGFLLSFEITGKNIDQVLLSPKSPKPSRKNDLWKETCFECFFGVGNSKQYFEFNGSTSGDWALYSFDDYRKGMKEVETFQQPFMEKLEKTENVLSVAWRIPYFTKLILQNASITSVIKFGAQADEVSYWALKHAGEKPDFHLRESYIHRFI